MQLIGTAHGNNLDNLMLNPTLSDLIGGIQSVTLGDEEARRRRTQKSVLERKAPPTFDVVVEIQSRDRVMVHPDVADTVDALLRGDPIAPELRWRDETVACIARRLGRGPGRRRSCPASVSAAWSAAARAGVPSRAGDRIGGAFDSERGTRPGYRPGASGGWRRDAAEAAAAPFPVG